MTEIAANQSTDRKASASYSVWLRMMALLYDPFVWLGEVMGMRRRRRNLVADASGRVVEIGAGTGLNVGHYPEGLDELVLTEPEPDMRRKLVRQASRRALAVRVVGAPAERLPFADASADTVVSTLVLCTVDNPEQALREIARVLRPGGRLLFIEHVRASSRFLSACQDGLLRPWRGFAGGCVCNRPTLELMRGCGFTVEAKDQVWRGMPAIVHPLIVGSATVSPSTVNPVPGTRR
ncbi:class I SAM-dependent methyltransferase [Mycolicibacterium helvum]|uniref:Type 11 methyltransferase n=1 Tax=Mycolicibacterium helvum TaxID=1534349 RepID=A0A7I7TC75_9MYCO|nr:class I SAM-dependent methyltransferase [Mycolicibacterium helvum]BBY66882.1 type 11 methyltransferase [Mycolicibacterium helvum]